MSYSRQFENPEIPPPREVEIPIDNLLPTQAMGVGRYRLGFIRAIRKTLKPVEVVLYDGEAESADASYLLIDGHHRACINYWDGNETIRAKSVETDAQVLGSIILWGEKCYTLEDVRRRYQEIWLPSIKAKGIDGISSLPAYAEHLN